MKTELEKFRSRWLRWLGQKTRVDKSHWVTLLDCNWYGWATGVLDEHGVEYTSQQVHNETRENVKKLFTDAIERADIRALMKLDNLYAGEKAGLL
jgi:hypothetical protein